MNTESNSFIYYQFFRNIYFNCEICGKKTFFIYYLKIKKFSRYYFRIIESFLSK